jgi:hypothetical protein
VKKQLDKYVNYGRGCVKKQRDTSITKCELMLLHRQEERSVLFNEAVNS